MILRRNPIYAMIHVTWVLSSNLWFSSAATSSIFSKPFRSRQLVILPAVWFGHPSPRWRRRKASQPVMSHQEVECQFFLHQWPCQHLKRPWRLEDPLHTRTKAHRGYLLLPFLPRSKTATSEPQSESFTQKTNLLKIQARPSSSCPPNIQLLRLTANHQQLRISFQHCRCQRVRFSRQSAHFLRGPDESRPQHLLDLISSKETGPKVLNGSHFLWKYPSLRQLPYTRHSDSLWQQPTCTWKEVRWYPPHRR